jgi:hypothetical protein
MIGRMTVLAACTVAGVGFFTSVGTAAAQEDPEQGGGTSQYFPDRSGGGGSVVDGGLDRTSVALGALAGIALTGIGVGATLTVAHFRDHSPAHPA